MGYALVCTEMSVHLWVGGTSKEKINKNTINDKKYEVDSWFSFFPAIFCMILKYASLQPTMRNCLFEISNNARIIPGLWYLTRTVGLQYHKIMILKSIPRRRLRRLNDLLLAAGDSSYNAHHTHISKRITPTTTTPVTIELAAILCTQVLPKIQRNRLATAKTN